MKSRRAPKKLAAKTAKRRPKLKTNHNSEPTIDMRPEQDGSILISVDPQDGRVSDYIPSDPTVLKLTPSDDKLTCRVEPNIQALQGFLAGGVELPRNLKVAVMFDGKRKVDTHAAINIERVGDTGFALHKIAA